MASKRESLFKKVLPLLLVGLAYMPTATTLHHECAHDKLEPEMLGLPSAEEFEQSKQSLH
jgi:hypothetical protein